jgi:hypothetical protein
MGQGVADNGIYRPKVTRPVKLPANELQSDPLPALVF